MPLNFDNISAREASIRRMASLLAAHGDLLADMVHVAIPDDVEGPVNRMAYLFAAAMVDVHARRSLKGPAYEAMDRIREAEDCGHPYTPLVQDAMSEKALSYIPYWAGQKYGFADEVFWRALLYGNVSEFDGIKAIGQNYERQISIESAAAAYKKVADKAYEDAVAAAKKSRDDAIAEVEAKMAELVKPEQDAFDKADKAWRSRGPSAICERMVYGSAEAQDMAEDLHAERETAKEALDIAKHERYPAYFIKSAEADDAYKKAVADAEQIRNEAYQEAEKRAAAEYDAAHGTGAN